MRKVILAFALVLAVATVAMAGSNEMTYQGKLTDLAGVPVVGDTTVIFTIYTAPSGGSALWAETLTVSTDVNGVFTADLGGVHPIGGGILTAGDRYLGIQVSGDTEMTPRQSLNAAPYGAGGVPTVGQVTLSGSTTSTSAATLDSFIVQVPGPGVLLVTVTGSYWLDADATSTTSIISLLWLGLCTTGNSSASCGGTWGDYYSQDPDNATSTNKTPSFTLTRTFNVGAAGPMKFFVNGSTDNVAHTLSLYGGHCRATAMWFPGAMTLQLTHETPEGGVQVPVQQRQ